MNREVPTVSSRPLLVGMIAVLLAAPAAAKPPVYATPAEKAFVDALMAKMTVEEKLGQLNQPAGVGNNTGPAAMTGNEDQIRMGEIGTYLGTQGAVLTCRLQRIAVEQSRLGIPLMFGYDVIHGHRTVFPVPLGESASFDPVEVQHAARVAAIEASAHGIHWTYAPMVDIARDPRWGRVVEGAGEDPYLGSVLAAARVRGFQGDDLRKPDAVLATAKHFVAYGAAEAGRDYNVADISERTLHEVYLPPFKAAVDAGAQSIMAAFNEIAGVPMHAHRPLIEDLLRKEWGWDGLLVSDYTGVMELMPHGVAADRKQAGALGLRAGVDVDMVSQIYVKDLPAEVKAGRVPMAQVDASVRRVLNAKYRLGLFENPYRSCTDDGAHERAMTLTPQHRADARRMAQKSLVLLENDNDVLPLSKSVRTLAVIGPLADHRRAMLGNWAVAGREEDAVTPIEGLKAALGDGTRLVIAKGADIDSQDTSGFAQAVAAAKQADAVVMFLGEHPDMSAEANNRTSLDLPGVQEQLALAVAATGKPVVAAVDRGPEGQGAGDPRSLVPRRRGRPRDHRRAVRRRQSVGQAAGDVPAQRRPGADLLRAQEHRPSAERAGEVHQQVPRRAVDAAVRLRPRTQLHDVPLRRADRGEEDVGAFRPAAAGERARQQHRQAGGRRGGATVCAGRRRHRHPSGETVARLPASVAGARRIEDGHVRPRFRGSGDVRRPHAAGGGAGHVHRVCRRQFRPDA